MISSKSNNNYVFTLVILLLIIGAISIIIIGSKAKISNGEIKLSGIFRTIIQIEDIKELKLINEVSRGIRIFGLSLGPFEIGIYSYKGIGKVKVYITSNELPFLLIRDENNALLIGNGREKNKTLYNSILNEMLRK